jgi:hypothetical protein
MPPYPGIALTKFVSLYFPTFGTPTRLDRADNALSGKYQAHQALNCPFCGVMFQLVTKTDLLRAATASGGDGVEYFITDNEEEDSGNLNWQ